MLRKLYADAAKAERAVAPPLRALAKPSAVLRWLSRGVRCGVPCPPRANRGITTGCIHTRAWGQVVASHGQESQSGLDSCSASQFADILLKCLLVFARADIQKLRSAAWRWVTLE